MRGNRYQAYIRLNNKNYYVGYYDLEVDAAWARDQVMAARPPRDTKGNEMPITEQNFQTEQDWLNARQVEIDERRLKTVQSVDSGGTLIKAKVKELPAREAKRKQTRGKDKKKEQPPKKKSRK